MGNEIHAAHHPTPSLRRSSFSARAAAPTHSLRTRPPAHQLRLLLPPDFLADAASPHPPTPPGRRRGRRSPASRGLNLYRPSKRTPPFWSWTRPAGLIPSAAPSSPLKHEAPHRCNRFDGARGSVQLAGRSASRVDEGARRGAVLLVPKPPRRLGFKGFCHG